MNYTIEQEEIRQKSHTKLAAMLSAVFSPLLDMAEHKETTYRILDSVCKPKKITASSTWDDFLFPPLQFLRKKSGGVVVIAANEPAADYWRHREFASDEGRLQPVTVKKAITFAPEQIVIFGSASARRYTYYSMPRRIMLQMQRNRNKAGLGPFRY